MLTNRTVAVGLATGATGQERSLTQVWQGFVDRRSRIPTFGLF